MNVHKNHASLNLQSLHVYLINWKSKWNETLTAGDEEDENITSMMEEDLTENSAKPLYR